MYMILGFSGSASASVAFWIQKSVKCDEKSLTCGEYNGIILKQVKIMYIDVE